MARDSTGPAEYAVRAVADWITGDDITDDTATEANALQEPSGDRRGVDLRVARVVEQRPGIWAVTVSGRVAEPVETEERPQEAGTNSSGGDTDQASEQVSGLRYWRIAISARGDADAGGTGGSDENPGHRGAYAVLGLPAEVAGPGTAQPPELVYGTAVSGAPGELGETIEGFVFAYLTGLESVDRYTTPDARIAGPGGYLEAGVSSIAAAGDVDLGSPIEPRDGRKLDVLVTVQPVGQAGDAPALQYAVTVQARDGRWEIAAIADAPRTQVDHERQSGGDR